MKILIIYYSGKHTKNTEKIANIFKNEIDCDLLEFNEKLNQQLISNYDIVGFGSGIYAGSFKRSFKKWIKKLPAISNKKCFVFSTAGSKMGEKVNKKIIDILVNKNFTSLGQWSCLGRDVAFTFKKKTGGFLKDRPNQQDLENAKQWIKSIIH